jgi:hypothetical protein
MNQLLIQQIFSATGVIYGRSSAGTGQGEELTPAAARTLLGVSSGSITFVLDGGGAVIAAGQTLDLPDFPYAANITGWTITGDVSGSAVVTISKATYANYPTFTAISGTEKPTLSSAQKNQDLAISTWTTALAQGDVLRASVDSASTVKRLTVTIRYTR